MVSSSAAASSVATGSYIDGERRPSGGENRVDVINPSTGEPLLSFSEASVSDVDAAVDAARRCFDDGGWSDDVALRVDALRRFAELIAEEAELLDTLDAEEMGKPVSTRFCNAAGGAEYTRYYAEAVDKASSRMFSSAPGSLVGQRRVPRGVVGAIVPWNFPTFNALMKLAPALAAGNTVVLKPSELASRSALKLAELASCANMPAGAFNVLPGLGSTVGQSLAVHRDVNMIAFTGSTATAKKLLKCSAETTLKTVIAECGGKSPQIVFDDGVDLDEAADTIADALLTNQGQICSVGSRLLVARRIEDALVARIARRFRETVPGIATDPGTSYGPLASEAQRGRVLGHIEAARSSHAELVTGGGCYRDLGGWFVEPTLFRDVSPDQRLAREEIFGPVLAVTAFDTESEAFRLANATAYGLMAYVWTARLGTGLRAIETIRSSVIINASAPRSAGAGHGASFEPAGESGIGVEGGIAGMESYLRRKTFWFNH